MVADVLPARGVQVQFALTHALIQSLLIIIMRMTIINIMMMIMMITHALIQSLLIIIILIIMTMIIINIMMMIMMITHAVIQSLLVIIMRMMMVVDVMMVIFLMAMMHTSYLSQTRQTLSVEQKNSLEKFCST